MPNLQEVFLHDSTVSCSRFLAARRINCRPALGLKAVVRAPGSRGFLTLDQADFLLTRVVHAGTWSILLTQKSHLQPLWAPCSGLLLNGYTEEAPEAEEWFTFTCLAVYLVKTLGSSQPMSCYCALSSIFGIGIIPYHFDNNISIQLFCFLYTACIGHESRLKSCKLVRFLFKTFTSIYTKSQGEQSSLRGAVIKWI